MPHIHWSSATSATDGQTEGDPVGLGINKDLEPLVRCVRRAGGSVEITKSTHVRWDLPDGSVIFSGLTMQGGNAQKVRRDIERSLGIDRHPKPKRKGTAAKGSGRGPRNVPSQAAPAPARGPHGRVEAAGKKFRVIRPNGEPLCNAQGFPRTFGDEREAAAVAEGL